MLGEKPRAATFIERLSSEYLNDMPILTNKTVRVALEDYRRTSAAMRHRLAHNQARDTCSAAASPHHAPEMTNGQAAMHYASCGEVSLDDAGGIKHARLAVIALGDAMVRIVARCSPFGE